MIDLLILLLIMIAIFAVASYVINAFLPIDPALKNLIMLILGVIFVIWLLMALTGAAPATYPWRRHP